MSEPNKHALLSPSGAAGWLVCAGKPAMEFGYPDDSNEYSDYGTAAHEVAKLCLDTEADPAAYFHRRIDVGNCKTVEVDEEMVGGVRLYVNAVRQRISDYKLAGAVSVDLFVEQRVPIGHITGEVGAEGTADVVLVVTWADGTVLCHVIDLKFGQGVKVQAENNPQGMLYALGTVKKMAMVADFSRVVVAIHQPRVSEEPSEWEIPIAELEAFGAHASAQAKVAMAAYEARGAWIGKPEQAQYLEAGDHCRKTFCKARATCPKLAAFVEQQVGADFGAVAAVADPARTDIDKPAAVAALVPQADDQLSVKMRATDIIEDWCKAVRAEVERRLLAGVPVPSFKLVGGRLGNRSWESEEEAEKLMKAFRLKKEEMYRFTLITPTAAEKLVPKLDKLDKDGKPKDAAAKTPIKLGQWQKLVALVTRAPGKPSVAPESDPRPALVVAPITEGFAPVVAGGALV